MAAREVSELLLRVNCGQGRAEDQQFYTSLIGEAGAENGLKAQGNGVPDAAGGPATVREDSWEGGRRD